MVPSIRSRRVVLNGGLHLSVVDDLTCSMTISMRLKLCSTTSWMRLSMAASIRSRRVVLKGGPLLSESHEWAIFMTRFDVYDFAGLWTLSHE